MTSLLSSLNLSFHLLENERFNPSGYEASANDLLQLRREDMSGDDTGQVMTQGKVSGHGAE